MRQGWRWFLLKYSCYWLVLYQVLSWRLKQKDHVWNISGSWGFIICGGIGDHPSQQVVPNWLVFSVTPKWLQTCSRSQSPSLPSDAIFFPVAHKWFLRLRAWMWAFSTPWPSWCSTQTPKNNAFSIRATFVGEGMTLIGWRNGDWHWLVPACLCGQEPICIMQTFAVCRGSVCGVAGRNIKGWTSQ